MATGELDAGALARRRSGPGTVERLKRAFFGAFFRLLLGFVGVAEWACVAWALHAAGVRIPVLFHLLGPLAFLIANRVVILRRRAPNALFDPLVRVYVAVAFTAMFAALFLALSGIVWSLGAAVARLAGTAPFGAGFAHGVTAGLAAIGALFLYGYTIGRRHLAVTQIDVPIPGLPSSFDGFRIVQLSDLHIGAYLDRRGLAAHVERVNAMAPDLVCLTGDLVDRPETCDAAFPVLAGLRARHGVLTTLGNHDVYAGADVVTAALRRHTDFTVMRNARADLTAGGATLPVLGVDDLGLDWARGVREHPALPALAATVEPGTPFVVLSHRPDCFPQAAGLGAALVLSGHTHGGQIGLPFLRRGRTRNLAEFITAFDRGLYRAGTATLYVNRGLGFTGQPIRLFTPREIACLTLRSA